MNGCNRVASQFRRDISREDGQAENLDMKGLLGRLHGLEVLPTVTAQSEIQLLSRDGVLENFVVAIQLVPYRRANEVRAIRVKAVPDHQVDAAKIHVAEVDGNLLSVGRARTEFVNLRHLHPHSIFMDGRWMSGCPSQGEGVKVFLKIGAMHRGRLYETVRYLRCR